MVEMVRQLGLGLTRHDLATSMLAGLVVAVTLMLGRPIVSSISQLIFPWVEIHSLSIDWLPAGPVVTGQITINSDVEFGHIYTEVRLLDRPSLDPVCSDTRDNTFRYVERAILGPSTLEKFMGTKSGEAMHCLPLLIPGSSYSMTTTLCRFSVDGHACSGFVEAPLVFFTVPFDWNRPPTGCLAE